MRIIAEPAELDINHRTRRPDEISLPCNLFRDDRRPPTCGTRGG
jgi:hypothetical protein